MKNNITLAVISLVLSQAVNAQNFTVVDSLPVGAYGTAAWGDFDGDGRKDLAYITQVATVGGSDIFNVYHNTVSGFVQVSQTFAHLFNPAICWGDLDNDGREDLVVSGLTGTTLECSIQIFKSIGNGMFTLLNDTLPGLSAGALSIADYNNDGLKDIAASGGDDVATPLSYIFKNKGGFQFEDIRAGIVGSYSGELRWCDYDKDGNMDIALTGDESMNHARTRIYHNEGNDSFSLVSGYMKGGRGTLDWLDYNGDGFMDLLAAGVDSSATHNFTDLYENNGNGTFTKQTSFNSPLFGEPVATDVADFNADGITDICFGGGNDSFFNYSAMAFGNGSPMFNFNEFEKIDIQNCIVAAADYDNDGDADLFFSNFILRNDNPTKVKDNEVLNASVYPNPVSKTLFIDNDNKAVHVSLMDITGHEILSEDLKPGQRSIDVSGYANGTYLLWMGDSKKSKVSNVVIYH